MASATPTIAAPSAQPFAASAPLVSIPFEPTDSLGDMLAKLSDCADMIEGATRPVPPAVTEALLDGLLGAVVRASVLSDGPGDAQLLDAISAWQEARGRF